MRVFFLISIDIPNGHTYLRIFIIYMYYFLLLIFYNATYLAPNLLAVLTIPTEMQGRAREVPK